MRRDISNVLGTRGRYSSYQGDKGYFQDCPRDVGDMPVREGMKDRYVERKERALYANPLKGYFRNSVGRSWDKVYSEICENLRPDSHAGRHVLRYVSDFVELCPMRVQFEGWGEAGYWNHDGRPIGQPYYVCPRTGVLCETKKEWQRWSPKRVESYFNQEWKIVNNVFYRKIKGSWYEIILARVPKAVREADHRAGDVLNVKDVVTGDVLNMWTCQSLRDVHGDRTNDNLLIGPNSRRVVRYVMGSPWYDYYRPIYAKDRRQLSVKEVRRLDLSSPHNLRAPNVVR